MKSKQFLFLSVFSFLSCLIDASDFQQLKHKKAESPSKEVRSASTYYFAPGSILNLIPSEAITKKPKVFATYKDPVTGKSDCKANIKVVDKISPKLPSTKFMIQWVKYIRLYDKKVFKGKAIGALLTANPALVKDLTLDSLSLDGDTDFGGAVFLYQKPSITSVDGTLKQGEKIVVAGKSFGLKAPKISVEYTDGKGKVKYKTCKVDKTGFIYEDITGKSSAMNPANGASQVTVFYPKLKDTDVPTDYIVLDNNSGICVFKKASSSAISFGGIQLAYASGADEVTLDWAEAVDNNNASSTFSYYIYKGTEDDLDTVYQESNLVATVTDATETIVTGLTANTDYYFLAVAKSSGGATNQKHRLVSATTMNNPLEVEYTPVDMDTEISDTIQVSEDESTVTVAADVTSKIKEGDIIIVPENDVIKNTLKKVSAISSSGTETTISVTDSALCEVLNSGELSTSATLSDPDNLPLQQSKELRRNLAGRSASYQQFLMEKEIYEEEGRKTYLDPEGRFLLVKEEEEDTVTLTTGLELTPILEFEPILKTMAQWEERTLAPDRLQMAAVIFGGKLTAGGKLSFEAEAGIDKPYTTGKKYLWEKPRTMKFRYVVGGVPVYQEVFLNFVCEADFQPKAALEMSSELTLEKEVKCAIRWVRDLGWNTSASEGFEKKVEYTVKVKGGAVFNIKIYPEVSTRFYRTLTGTLSVKPKLTLAADLEADLLDNTMSQFTKFDLGIGADIQMGAKLGIFSETIIEKETDDIEILSPINFFTLPTVEFASTPPTTGAVNTEIGLGVKVTDGTNNPVSTSSCEWFVSPSANTTINPSSIALLDPAVPGVYLDTTKFTATAENTYNVYYSMKGSGFLGDMGKRIVKAEIEIGNTVVEFPDANLKAAVQTALDAAMGGSGNTLNMVNLMKITVLDASGSAIADLSGLQYCKGLKELDISSNSISSISLLSSLTGLEKFNFQYNSGITDISVLSYMTKLIELKFGGNGTLADVSSLAGLSKLTLLWIQGQGLPADALTHISKLTNITYSLALTNITISGGKLSDISALSAMVNVANLNLYNNNISDISPLSKITAMVSLQLGTNPISSLSGLETLTKMEKVLIQFCPNLEPGVSDLSALLSMPLLKDLYIDNAWKVKDLEGNYLYYPIGELVAKGVILH